MMFKLMEIPPINNDGNEYLGYWEDFLTEGEIYQLLSVPEWTNLQPGSVGYGAPTNIERDGPPGTINPVIRSSEVAWLHPTPETHHIFSKIVNVIANVNRKLFKLDLTGLYEPAQLTLYKADSNGHYNWHRDDASSTPQNPRKLSMSLLLSNRDEFEGGDLQVLVNGGDPVTVEQKRGRAWFFPSYSIHRVTEVTRGVRRSLVLWVGGPPLR